MKQVILTLITALAAAPGFAVATELTMDALQGMWMFTRILMDGEREMPVNRPIEFLADGAAVMYNPAGQEVSRASYAISSGAITYTDDKGTQVWKLISIDEQSLHVDHRGAEMFFERQ